MLKLNLILPVVLLGLVSLGSQASRRYPQIDPAPPLKIELNQVLKFASEFQKASYAQDERAFEASLSQLIGSIDRAWAKADLARDQKPHLTRILRSAKLQLQSSRNQLGTKRSQSVKEAFAQIVQLIQIYKLDSYRIFFCSKDRAVWIQTDSRAQNPVSPDRFASCGKLVQ